MIVQNSAKIEQVIQDIQERFGAKAVQRLSEYKPPPLYATGLRKLDELLGGGLPSGAMTLFQGNMTSGRGTLVQHILSHELDVKVYVDIGGTFDPESAVKCGVDLDRLVIVRPTTPGENSEAVELLGALISLRVPLIVLDDSISLTAIQLPAFLMTKLAQFGSVLLALPPARQVIPRAAARLIVEREAMVRRPVTGEVIGYHSRITIIEPVGVRYGTHIDLDILMEDT